MRRRWTLIACPECGMQAPRGYECSGGGDGSHSLNVPVEPVEAMPVAEHEARVADEAMRLNAAMLNNQRDEIVRLRAELEAK